MCCMDRGLFSTLSFGVLTDPRSGGEGGRYRVSSMPPSRPQPLQPGQSSEHSNFTAAAL